MPRAVFHRRAVAGLSSGGHVLLTALHEGNAERYPHLLASTAQGAPQARFSLLFAFPETRLILDAGGVLRHGGGGAKLRDAPLFLDAFDALWREHGRATLARGEGRSRHDAKTPPFTGGWLVYLGYELARQIETKLTLPPSPHALPQAEAIRFPAVVVYDHALGETFVLAEDGRESLMDAMCEDAYRSDLALRKEKLREDGGRGGSGRAYANSVGEDAPEPYLAAVRTCIDYIRAGELFQANLSRAWRARLNPSVRPSDLFLRLARANPAPFAALLTWGARGTRAVVSSSPERLVSVRDGVVETRPIAGTRPRGSGAFLDIALSRELLAHPKERAEHIMLVDLERNDLSRICREGTVQVDEMMVVESYAHVHHIVSNVRGALAAATTPGQVMAAMFPGGTITGCPKVRCMEVLAELEGEGRGAYTGSVGYVNHDGSMDMNILIRTFVCEGEGVHFRAGGGIVADSVPERELAECRAKARGLIRALRETP